MVAMVSVETTAAVAGLAAVAASAATWAWLRYEAKPKLSLTPTYTNFYRRPTTGAELAPMMARAASGEDAEAAVMSLRDASATDRENDWQVALTTAGFIAKLKGAVAKTKEDRVTDEYCKCVLLTGGVGFVGSHIGERLLADGIAVVMGASSAPVVGRR